MVSRWGADADHLLRHVPIALRYWRWSVARTRWCGSVHGHQWPFLVASSLKFMEAASCRSRSRRRFPCHGDLALGRKATFAAYAARSTMTMADVVALHRSGTSFLERNALIMRRCACAVSRTARPRWLGFYGALRGFSTQSHSLEVVHPKVPISMTSLSLTVFDRTGSRQRHRRRIALASWKSRMSSCVSRFARHREIDLPGDPGQWIVMSRTKLAAGATNEPVQTFALPTVPLPSAHLRLAYHTYHLARRFSFRRRSCRFRCDSADGRHSGFRARRLGRACHWRCAARRPNACTARGICSLPRWRAQCARIPASFQRLAAPATT